MKLTHNLIILFFAISITSCKQKDVEPKEILTRITSLEKIKSIKDIDSVIKSYGHLVLTDSFENSMYYLDTAKTSDAYCYVYDTNEDGDEIVKNTYFKTTNKILLMSLEDEAKKLGYDKVIENVMDGDGKAFQNGYSTFFFVPKYEDGNVHYFVWHNTGRR